MNGQVNPGGAARLPHLTRMEDINRMARDAMSLFDWTPIPLGHPLRNHAYSYHHWGIALTPENIDEIRAESKRQYMLEWAPTDQSVNSLIGVASNNADLSDTNLLLNLLISQYCQEHVARLHGSRRGPIRLVEIGTGAGGTILAVLDELRKSGVDLSRLDITLSDPSPSRLAFAMEQIKHLLDSAGCGRPALRTMEGTVDVLRALKTGFAHAVFQNAAIHHESFKDHLLEINRVLKPGMPFISGDWHEGTYETPARIYWIYSMLQNPFDKEGPSDVLAFALGGKYPDKMPERRELKEFRRIFALDDAALAAAFGQYSESERRASYGGMKYWLEVAKMLTKAGKKCPEVLIQGHERVSRRIAALANAGFAFDSECRAKYREVIRDRGYGELGAVMVAKKSAASTPPRTCRK